MRAVAWPVPAAALLVAGVVSGCAGAPGHASPAEPGPGSPAAGVLILVRHAEAEHDPGGDPPLTAAGLLRADRLADLLRDAGIEAIHTSDYRRTRATAAPIAALTGLAPLEYDARQPDMLVARLLPAGGRRLVVGHSNTIPDLVRLLGGEPGPEIDAGEHDRVYVVVLEGGTRGAVRTILLRY